MALTSLAAKLSSCGAVFGEDRLRLAGDVETIWAFILPDAIADAEELLMLQWTFLKWVKRAKARSEMSLTVSEATRSEKDAMKCLQRKMRGSDNGLGYFNATNNILSWGFPTKSACARGAHVAKADYGKGLKGVEKIKRLRTGAVMQAREPTGT